VQKLIAGIVDFRERMFPKDAPRFRKEAWKSVPQWVLYSMIETIIADSM
jgi:hypothetical protein